MKKYPKHMGFLLSAAAMLVLILDSKTAMLATAQGIELCIQTVIPSLFPMIIISSYLTQWFNGQSISLLQPMEKLLGLPQGAGGIYLTGLVGGYPIGAKCVAESYRNKSLSYKQANRMLGFCNNPGPAFLFGICGPFFITAKAVWLLWGIQILSSLLTGIILRENTQEKAETIHPAAKSISEIVTEGTKTMAVICGWVVLFRVLIRFSQSWFLWLFPAPVQVVLSGFLELTNGCCMLSCIRDESVRFIICSTLLSMGGLCVAMQTVFVTKVLRFSAYLKGKLIQTLIGALLSTVFAQICFPSQPFLHPKLWRFVIILSVFFLILSKLGMDFPKRMLYNANRNQKKRLGHAVSKKN